MTNQFIQLPKYEPLPDGVNWVSHGKMKYVDPWGEMIVIPTGETSDFASIPDLSRIGLIVQLLSFLGAQWFWPLYILVFLASVVIFIAESFLHEGTWDHQAFLHDWMFRTRCRSFWKANWILFVSMKSGTAPKTPAWKRVLIFGGVAVGGYFAWVGDSRRR